MHKLEETAYYEKAIILISKINASSYCYFARGRSYSQFADMVHNSGVVVWDEPVSVPGNPETNVSFSQLYS